MNGEKGSWEEYQRLVLHELQSLSKSTKDIKQEMATLKDDIATLKVKSGMWGASAGAFVIIIALAIKYLEG